MKNDAFELEIIHPTKSEKKTVAWVEVESPTGNFVVGPNHSPLISILKPRGKLTYQVFEGTEASMDIYGGIFKVLNNKVVVLLEE